MTVDLGQHGLSRWPLKLRSSKSRLLDSTDLSKLVSRFPIVKEDTATLQKTVISYAGYPLELAHQGQGALLKIYTIV